ncbi:hypothetical protein EMMF5_001331 [Cystobasidiomycetes sp. EMM_F5]
MSLLALPDALLWHIAQRILNAGWDYDRSEWIAGDAEALRSFRLVHPRVAKLCVDLVYSKDHIVPVEENCKVKWPSVYYLYHRMGQTTPHVELRLGIYGLCCANSDEPCYMSGKICSGQSLRTFEKYDSVVADYVSNAKGVKSFEIHFYNDCTVSQNVPFYPKARAAIFGHPTALYFKISNRGDVDLQIHTENLKLMRSPKALRVPHMHGTFSDDRLNAGLAFYQALAHQSTWSQLDLAMHTNLGTLRSDPAPNLPLIAGQPWSQLTYFRLDGVDDSLEKSLRPYIAASLSASAPTLQSLCVSMNFIIQCRKGTTFRALQKLWLSAEFFKGFPTGKAELDITFPALDFLDMDEQAACEVALCLLERPTAVPSLKKLVFFAPAGDGFDRVAKACASRNIFFKGRTY